jgi:HEAT repeat protein
MQINTESFKRRRASKYLSVLIFCALCCFAPKSFAQDDLGYLAQRVNHGNTEQKRDALFQIRNLETAEASRVAVPALRDSSEIVRATAAYSVIFLPSDEAAQVLLPLLKDKSPFVRKEASYALGRTRSAQAVRPLIEILQNDKILEVKGAAAVALGETGDAAAVEALVKILQKNSTEDEEFLHQSAARSIGQIAQFLQTGEFRAVTPESFLPEKYKLVKPFKYPNLPESFPAFRTPVNTLIEILKNSREYDSVRREAAFALGAIGDARAVSVLQASQNAEDYYLAEISREALKKISSLKQN